MKKIVVTIAVFLISSYAFSQDGGIAFEDDVVDNTIPPAAPINTYIYIILIIAITYAFYTIYSKKKQIV